MADLIIQDVIEAGLNATYASAASGGDAVQNLQGDVVLHFKNTNVAARTVTITAQGTSQSVPDYGDMTKASLVINVPAGEERFVGPFPKRAFNDANSKVQLTYSAVTDLTVAALRVQRAV